MISFLQYEILIAVSCIRALQSFYYPPFKMITLTLLRRFILPHLSGFLKCFSCKKPTSFAKKEIRNRVISWNYLTSINAISSEIFTSMLRATQTPAAPAWAKSSCNPSTVTAADTGLEFRFQSFHLASDERNKTSLPHRRRGYVQTQSLALLFQVHESFQLSFSLYCKAARDQIAWNSFS